MPILSLLLASLVADVNSSFTDKKIDVPAVQCPMNSKREELTEEDIENAANELGVEKCSMVSVSQIESKGKGFSNSGNPKILFEPHKMWANLKKDGYKEDDLEDLQKEGYDDVLYKKQGEKKYGKEAAQWRRINKASEIDRDNAIKSASWGKFQVMGEYYKDAGYASPSEMLNAMCSSEKEHLKMFMAFVKKNKLVKSLNDNDWETFARKYNGKSYKKFNYDKQLENNYNICKGKELIKKRTLP